MPIVVAIFAVLAGILGYAATRPNDFTIRRSNRIKAPPEKIFTHLTDFHEWGAWSPWEGLDPAMTRTYSGSSNGVGAVYEWEGNKKVGAGRMEITGLSAPTNLTLKLDFIRPFEAHNTTEFQLQPAGDSTEVVWLIRGPSPFMSKLMGVFMNMDKLIGKDFETGLANLKRVSESTS
jgi:hypothetical protein